MTASGVAAFKSPINLPDPAELCGAKVSTLSRHFFYLRSYETAEAQVGADGFDIRHCPLRIHSHFESDESDSPDYL